ncbi:MAG TPA: hypothetical protein VMZ53_34370, partial [Kofleriaceae bacterium]|nr:hypothetical protein [Kofleriaceae bacterium]
YTYPATQWRMLFDSAASSNDELSSRTVHTLSSSRRSCQSQPRGSQRTIACPCDEISRSYWAARALAAL